MREWSLFDKVYPDGDPTHALSVVFTYSVGPGEGITFDLVIPHAGEFVFVDHSFAHLDKGAAGVLDLRVPGTELGKPNIQKITGATTPSPVAASPTRPYKFDPARAAQLYTSTCAACH